jgi:hypothetical protein
MPPPFQLLTTLEAKTLVNNDIAFTGDFADWMIQEIDDGQPEVFVAKLAPITLHRPLSFLNGKNKLAFSITPNADALLRFKDVNKPPASCELDTLGPHVVVLILPAHAAMHPGVDLTVKAGNGGDIIRVSKLGQGVGGKQIYIWYFKVIDPVDMVGWYDPAQLARTGVEVFFSTLFGRHSDYRLMEALTPVGEDDKNYYHDFSQPWKAAGGRDHCDETAQPRSEIWLDYVGDVGDGWNSTYAVAHSLAQVKLNLESPDGKKFETNRGEILIFGGDQVYPIASRLNYTQRLLGPYETALDSTSSPHPHAFAIPGNHDWYDSLVSFTRLFCQKRWFAGWQTDQTRSYFALKLPGGWWLLGTDVQLDSDIDVPQVNFFKKIAEKILPGDRVIVCTAEPHWISAKLYGQNDSNYNENNLAFFEKKIIPPHARVVAFVAGDQHHYRRYEADNCTQKITAGGGGAFLHPTHGEEAKELDGGFVLQKSYPTTAESEKLGRKNVLFSKFNPRFGIVTGAVYLLTAWAVMADVGEFGISQLWRALNRTLHAALINPFAVFWILGIFIGFLFFTDTHSKWYRWVAGPLHGIGHLAAAFFIGWAAAHFAFMLNLEYRHTFEYQSANQLFFSAGFIFLFGWFIGSTIMGVYLYISLNWCGRHSNEAFSALKIEDWKNFLRFKIEKNGNVTIYPIGIQKVPKKWKRRADGVGGSGYLPDEKSPLVPKLIEQPLLFEPVVDQEGGVKLSRL